jgi:hypothetical protein
MDDHATPTAAPTGATSAEGPGAAVGLADGTRFRCEGCGNLTRFDVVVAERTTRFWHVELSGVGTIESADVAERTVESITCRWCGSADQVVVEPSPTASTEG